MFRNSHDTKSNELPGNACWGDKVCNPESLIAARSKTPALSLMGKGIVDLMALSFQLSRLRVAAGRLQLIVATIAFGMGAQLTLFS